MIRAILLAVLLVGCAEPVVPAPQPGDTHNLPTIEWRIRNQAELVAVYENSGEALDNKNALKGFIGKDGDKWVMYTPPPRTVDDDVACTIGHEIMHVALGDYHK